MNSRFQIAAALLLCGSLFSQTAIQDPSDPHRGRISGIVLDERGQPLPDITVTATPPGPLAARVPSTQTDSQGRFAMAGLLPGRNYVNASNEELFYPDAWSGLWDADGSAQVIEVPAGGEASGIALTLKLVGRLEVKAKNAATGEAIDALIVRLERDGASNRFLEGSKMGNWFLVPTAPIRLRVGAAGFQSAWYGTPITLAPRQVLTVVVLLQPVSR
jgi:hypothetical protein